MMLGCCSSLHLICVGTFKSFVERSSKRKVSHYCFNRYIKYLYNLHAQKVAIEKYGTLSKYDVPQRGVSNLCDVINKQPKVYFRIKPVDDCPVEQPQRRAVLQRVLQPQ